MIHEVYHVTYLNRIPSIAEDGLVPDATSSMHGWMQPYSRGKIFLTEADGVSFWVHRLEDHALDQTDHPEDGWAPVVLRFIVPRSAKPLVADAEGTRDAGYQAWYVTKPILARALELWNGSEWVSIWDADAEKMQEAWLNAGTVESDESGEWWELDFDYFLPTEYVDADV